MGTGAGRINTRKNWNDILKELAGVFRRWGVEEYILPTLAESRDGVTVRYVRHGQWQSITCAAVPPDGWHAPARNLFAIKDCLDAVRRADQRGMADVMVQAAEALRLGDPNDPYYILGAEQGADVETLRAAYRRKVRQVHPDHGGDAQQFKRVQEAAAQLGIA